MICAICKERKAEYIIPLRTHEGDERPTPVCEQELDQTN